MDDFERELRAGVASAGLRRPSLKRKMMERRRRAARAQRQHSAHGLVRAARGFAGAGRRGRRSCRLASRDEQRKGEEAKQQVFTALRITNHALDQVMNAQLAEHDDKQQE